MMRLLEHLEAKNADKAWCLRILATLHTGEFESDIFMKNYKEPEAPRKTKSGGMADQMLTDANVDGLFNGLPVNGSIDTVKVGRLPLTETEKLQQ